MDRLKDETQMTNKKTKSFFFFFFKISFEGLDIEAFV